MQSAGCDLLCLPEKNPIMGFRRVLARIPHYFKLLARVHHALKSEKPDLVVLVDYPGLNMRIAGLANSLGIPVLYFICPQLWAWAPWRVRRFARHVDRALVIFPFEVPYFSAHGVSTRLVGHPVCDRQAGRVEADSEAADAASGQKILGLMPGSRSHEVEANLPVMLAAAERIMASDPDCVPVVTHLRQEIVAQAQQMAAARKIALKAVVGDMTGTARQARLCLVASGTATLEVAFTGTPLIALYRVSPLAARISPFVLTVPWFCQVNLIAGDQVVPEFLLSNDDPGKIVDECLALWHDTERRSRRIARLAAFRKKHFLPGALDRAAEQVLAFAGF